MAVHESRVVGDALRFASSTRGDEQLAKCGGTWLTAAELDTRSDEVAAGLALRGVTKGDRIAYMVPNRQEFLELFFAVAKLGAINVTLNYWLRGEILRHQLVNCGATMLIADAQGYSAVASILSDTTIADVVLLDPRPVNDDAICYQDIAIANGRPPATTIVARDPISIIFTSGTSGPSKGCVLPHGYYTSAGQALGQAWCQSGDRIITASPLFHATGQTISLMMALMNGASVCFETVFSASAFMRRATEELATIAFGVGPMAMAILAQVPTPTDPHNPIRLAVFPPMPVPAQLEFESRFDTQVIAGAYGQTECQPITITGVTGPRKRSTAGLPASHLEVRVVDENDRTLPVGQVGEVAVRPREPESMFIGYWNMPEATIEAWRNLWHHTGDSGFFDADGFFTFVDRTSDSLRRRGENISSFELESAITRHPKIARCAVVAVPSSLGDDDIKACIVLAPGQIVTPEEMFQHWKIELPYFAIPRYVDIRDSLPTTEATDRVRKHILRAEGVSAGTWDFETLGLTVERDQRRG